MKRKRKGKKKREKGREKSKAGKAGRGSRSPECTDCRHTTKSTNGRERERERDGHIPSEEGDASNLWRGQIIHITMPASNDERLHAAENDINTLFKNSDVLLRGMKQIQKQHNYLMQRDNNQARKEANMQAVIPNWPAQAQEQDRDHIIDWVGMLRFPHASSNLPPARTPASDRNPLPYLHADNTIPKDNAPPPANSMDTPETFKKTGLRM